MSHHKHPKHPVDPGEMPPALAREHALVFEAAVEAGRRAGRKTAKKKLKRAARHGGIKLSKALRDATLRDAEKAGGRAAYAAATKALRKARHRALPPLPPRPPGTGQEPAVAVAGPAPADTAVPVRTRVRGSQIVLEVLRVKWLSQSMVRIVAGGEGFADFESNGAADQHVKLLFANPALGLVPPYEMRSLRGRLAREDLPVSRSYTIRSHDPVARELAIDFFVHGTDGVGGSWAAGAKPGDLLVLSKSKGKFRPDAGAEQHLYVGDESAIPAIAAALEMLPRNAVGQVILEVDSAADEFEIDRPAGMALHWVHRSGEPSATSTMLANALRELPAAHGQVEILALGERSAMQEIRRLLSHWDLDQRRITTSTYWTPGKARRSWSRVPETRADTGSM
ncbi:siderophore-interacting protein [Paeniglutamicibacter psychrophenolicus]|uniref:siderophore-interacting protein n=1 Tax=Paeniglutamicibacter psychrophenolicus TaxID=257454 RepID=UPI002781A168|nr:siderophore-interacting protein [Paeniglutamicibacter psychrophenolicus]MDQ0092862.1 NADPH-dependent ferric siderophore reductase [Paeniglutamicibacter psychrophenolicus]